MKLRIRKAKEEDIPELRQLIEVSVRTLQAQDYTSEQMESALESVLGVDSQLISDGTYFVAEVQPGGTSSQQGESPEPAEIEGRWVLAGCGGWSKRKTLYGGDHWGNRENELLNPKHDPAKIRALFVHPEWARRGVGGRILEACEMAASSAGFTSYELGATLTGAKLFGKKGYAEAEAFEVPLKSGLTLPVIRMVKKI
ncbi:MAG TPA: GNAT family N-acetyltransferase [Candidatus Acidoferrum sp.]|nr:GNAT family N-acetyltransferase [Candidatus Acidoferrum sp.]